MNKPCVFCAIAAGDSPASVVVQEPGVTAFLDITPLFLGHVLVVPNLHRVTLGELLPSEVPVLFAAVQKMSRAVERAMSAQGTFVAMNNRVSQSVPHLHVHVVPRTKGDGLKGFFWPRRKYQSAEEQEEVRQRIASAYAESDG